MCYITYLITDFSKTALRRATGDGLRKVKGKTSELTIACLTALLIT